MRRVVVTGMGIVSSIGNNLAEVLASLRNATPGIVFGSLIFAGVMGILGGFFPALRAARMSPLEAMRG